MNQWKKQADDFLKNQSSDSEKVFSVSFLEEPNTQVKQKLKENKFTWNRFRKEYYGKGQKLEIEQLLKGCKYKLEEIIN